MSQWGFARRQTLQSLVFRMFVRNDSWNGDPGKGGTEAELWCRCSSFSGPLRSSGAIVACWSCPMLDCSGQAFSSLHSSVTGFGPPWVGCDLGWDSSPQKRRTEEAWMPTPLPAVETSSSSKGHLGHTSFLPPQEVPSTFLDVGLDHSVSKQVTAHWLGRMTYYFWLVRNRNGCLW